MIKLEIAPKTIGELVVEQIRNKGFTPHLTVDQQSRISVTIDEDLTDGDKTEIENGMPAWLKGLFEIRWLEVGE